MDGRFDGEPASPPANLGFAVCGKCPGRGVRWGVGQDVEYVVEVPEVPGGEGFGGARRCLAVLAGDGLAGGHDPGHPGEDAAEVADKVGGVPFGAVRYRPRPIRPSGRQQVSGVGAGHCTKVDVEPVDGHARVGFL